MAELNEGTVINDRFEIVSHSGTGGFASVWKGYDRELNREVAIKRLLSKQFLDPNINNEAVDEARKIAGISHPNIVSVFDVLKFGDEVLIVMEYLHGGSLHDLLRNLSQARKWLRPIECFDLIQGILRGLQAAHDAENGPIIHKDLKPLNILFDRRKQPKIADFGLASIGTVKPIETVHPGKWEHEGTLGYKSPEQLRGATLDIRSDLFNVGLIAYLLLAKYHPFIDPRFLFEYKEMVLKSYRPRQKFTSEDLPGELDDFFDSLLSLNPDNRFSTAAEALSELDHIKSIYKDFLLDQVLKMGDYLQGHQSDEVNLIDVDLARGIMLCKQRGFYSQGAFLYEKSGVDFAELDEETKISLDNDYSFCRRHVGQEVLPDDS